METIKINTVVLGAGPGGYVAAIRLAQLGVECLVVEKQYFGGVCLNVGCIPSKALIHVSKSYESVNKMSTFGIECGAARIDFAKTQTWKDGVVQQLTSGIRMLLKKNGAKILEGQGTFEDDHTLIVESSDGENTRVEFEHAIVATGSSPVEIPGFPFGGRILDSSGALALQEVPKSMLIIGGGYIGLELGFVYRKLGADVTVVEMMDSVLPGFDKDAVKLMTRKLKKDKFTVMTKARAVSYEETEAGVKVNVDHDGKEKTVEADYVFVSVGRKPNSRGFGLEKTGVEPDDSGFISVDKQMRTRVPHIFAIGDVAGQPMLAHHASYQGEIAAEVIAGHNVADQSVACPAVVFTDPEIAVVGMTEEMARAEGTDIMVGQFPFAALGKAKAQADTEGFVKVIAAKDTEEILGIVIAGHNAGDLIGEGLLAIEMGAYLDDVSLSIHPHPTLTEALMEAVKKAKGQAIHALN